MAITQDDIDIVLQKSQSISLRLDVYDSSDTKTGELYGYPKSLSGSITSDSDIRRTVNLVMHIPDKSYLSQNHIVSFMTKKIKVYIGLDDTAGTTNWYLFGSMLVSDTSTTYDAVTQDLSLPLVDMMASTTERRGSKINGYGLTIYAGANVRSALISIIETFTPFHQYSIPEFQDTIPYDLEFGIGIYPYEALKTIIALWPEYEMYYDPDGVFTVAKIPTLIDDPVFLDETVIDALMIKEDRSASLSSIKNTTEIIGMSIDADYTASTCTSIDDTYTVFIADTFEVLEDGALYGFTPDQDSVYGQKLKIQDTQEYEIFTQGASYDVDILIDSGAMVAGMPYCIKYTANRFYLQGQLEIHAIVQEVNTALTDEAKEAFKTAYDCRDVYWVVNPDSPFAADAIGTQIEVKSEDEFSNIPTVQLAIERGVYENWISTRLQNEIQLTLGLIPWLDVNKKIAYTNCTGSVSTVTTKSINFDLSNIQTPMTANVVDFYPYYPFVEKLYMEDGDIYTNYKEDNESLSFDIINGKLYYITDESFEDSPYARFTFSLSRYGSLVYTDGGE